MAFLFDAFHLTIHVISGQWFMVFSVFLIMATNGSGYLFGIYSKDIKSYFGYNQQTLNTISFFKDLGSNVGIFGGLLNEVAPPWVVLIASAGLNLSGYLMIYLSITGRVPRPHLWQMCLYICIGANSQSFSNTASLVASVKNFPRSRGAVIGLLKGFIGLSGAIFNQLYLAFYGGNTKALVLLVAWLPSAVCIVFLPVIRQIKVVHKENEFKVFCKFLYVTLTLAAYLMVLIILQKKYYFSHSEYIFFTSVLLVLILVLPLVIVFMEEIKLQQQLPHFRPEWSFGGPDVRTLTPDDRKDVSGRPETSIDTNPAIVAVEPTRWRSTFSGCLVDVFRPPKRGEDYTILQAILSMDMVILFMGLVLGMGGLLTAVDNMGQMGESLGYPSKSIGTFVSLISIWNYMGRVVAGFSSEILMTKYKLPRPVVLAAVLLLSCLAHLLIAFGVHGSLYSSSMIIGFCLGAQNPLMYAIVSEIFGLRFYSTLYSFIGLASPIASYVFNVRVTGRMYDREAERQSAGLKGKAVKAGICMGVSCFREAFEIIAVATAIGVAVMLVLAWRTWDFYKGDMYKKFREGEEAHCP